MMSDPQVSGAIVDLLIMIRVGYPAEAANSRFRGGFDMPDPPTLVHPP